MYVILFLILEHVEPYKILKRYLVLLSLNDSMDTNHIVNFVFKNCLFSEYFWFVWWKLSNEYRGIYSNYMLDCSPPPPGIIVLNFLSRRDTFFSAIYRKLVIFATKSLFFTIFYLHHLPWLLSLIHVVIESFLQHLLPTNPAGQWCCIRSKIHNFGPSPLFLKSHFFQLHFFPKTQN